MSGQTCSDIILQKLDSDDRVEALGPGLEDGDY